jgi:hypothetical protein
MFEAVVEVQVPVENLCQDGMMWQWLCSFPRTLEEGTKHLERLTSSSRSVAQQMSCRRSMLYLFECVLPSITHFFSVYYDPEDIPSDLPDDFAEDVSELPGRLAKVVSDFHKAAMKAGIPQAIVSEETASVMKKYAGSVQGYVAVDSPVAKGRRSSIADTVLDKRYSVTAIVAESKTEQRTELEESLSRRITALAESDEVAAGATEDINSLIKFIKEMPRQFSDTLPADIVHLRLEPLLKKLVRHVLSFVRIQGERKMLEAKYVRTTVWTISLFRKIIEYDWGFSVDERDEEGDDDSDANVQWIQDALDDAGATAMCLDLLARGLTSEVKDEAIKLLMALLFQEGGNQKVQDTINKQLNLPKSVFFLREVEDTLARISAFHQAAQDGDESEDDPPGILLLKALQLSCEGHYLPNQDIVRIQPDNEVSVNLLKCFVALLKDVSRFKGSSARGTITNVLDVTLEVIQGPCKGNQECLCLDTDLLETMNRMMRMKPEDDPAYDSSTEEEQEEIEEEVDEIKEIILCIFRAVLEGQGSGEQSAIYRRVLSVLHLEVLQDLLNPSNDFSAEADMQDLQESMIEQQRLEKLPLSPLQVQSLVLIKMLIGYNPALQDELTLSESVQKKMGTEVISIEVVWNGKLEKKYFKVPEICSHLAEESLDKVVTTVDRESRDKRLTDFVEQCGDILKELEHMEYLAKYGLAHVFSRGTLILATWLTFIINFAINIIYLFNLSHVADDSNSLSHSSGFQTSKQIGLGASIANPGSWRRAWKAGDDDDLDSRPNVVYVKDDWDKFKAPSKCLYGFDMSDHQSTKCYTLGDDSIQSVLSGLNYSQIVLATFTLILFLAVRIPISYRIKMEECGNDRLNAVWSFFTMGAINDNSSMTPFGELIYYVGYVVFAILGTTMSPFYNTVLLLDLMKKDATAATVAKSVWEPKQAIIITLVLLCFVIYIFAFLFFVVNEARGQAEFLFGECDYLLKCVQWFMGFGMRNGGGYADSLNGSSRYRMQTTYFLDWLFFVIVIIVFMSILFGIIIDKFSENREDKATNEEKTTEFCFICDSEKAEFDQISGKEWRSHIATNGGDHNMWAYLKFMIFLWQQDEDDDDGLEQYVRQCVEGTDFQWFPNLQCMRMIEMQDGDEPDSDLLEAIGQLQHKMHVELAKIQSHTSDQYKQIMDEISKLEADQGDIKTDAVPAKLNPLDADASATK